MDDEPDIRLVLRASLSREGGFEVSEASSGADGLAKAGELMPDAIVLDVKMPGLDGPATLTALRADARTASIPVVFLTAQVASTEIERLRALGVAGVLTKPFAPLTVGSQLKEILLREP